MASEPDRADAQVLQSLMSAGLESALDSWLRIPPSPHRTAWAARAARSRTARWPYTCRYWIPWFALAVGLAAHVGGYALRSSVTAEPLEFVGDLLYTLLGTLDWCRRGPVPPDPPERRRQDKQLLDAYEATLTDGA